MVHIPGSVVACLCCLFPALAIAAQADDRLEVHQLEARADDWLSKPVHVTGRFASASADRVRLEDSNIVFRLERASHKIHRGTKRLVMAGSLSRNGTQLVFDVSFVRELPSEVKQFKQERKRIIPGDYAELYALGQWARQRGQWYGDRSLKKLAKRADDEALDWEVDEAARRNDVQRMLTLAERAEKLKRPATDVMRIRHRSIWVARRRLPENDPAAVEALAARVRQILPGTETVTPPEQREGLGEYFKSPIATYAAASDEQLALFHRALWVDLVTEAMKLSAVNGSDLEELASRAKRLLPERPELWRRFRLDDLDRQAEMAGALTRGKLLAVRDGYRELDLPEKADAVVERWLAAMRAALSKDDIEARLQLAADYRSLANDNLAAAELYRQALAIAPELQEAREGLRESGYDYIDGQWQRVDGLDAAAMREKRKQQRGELSVGDSEEEVLRRFPSPDRIARTVSETSIVEQWIYDGPPAFYIYLRRDRTSDTVKVIATHRAPATR